MAGYVRIVVPIDLSSESDVIIRKALDMCSGESEVHLLYVQEPMDTVYLGVVPYGPVFVGMDQVEGRLKDELKQRLAGFGERFGVPEGRQHFLNGVPAKEIHRFVDEHGMDLVVLGTHGQKGVQLLLGSTANAVLHGANCDVLAVRVRDQEE
jgi:universal stress protein A